MGRGKKQCLKCKQTWGPRKKICTCGYDFNVQKGASKLNYKEIEDWTVLKRGDIIKSIQGHGPYYDLGEGKTESFGYHGFFKVNRVLKEGLGVYPFNNNETESGFCFLYMGEDNGGGITVKRAHKLELVAKSKGKDDNEIILD